MTATPRDERDRNVDPLTEQYIIAAEHLGEAQKADPSTSHLLYHHVPPPDQAIDQDAHRPVRTAKPRPKASAKLAGKTRPRGQQPGTPFNGRSAYHARATPGEKLDRTGEAYENEARKAYVPKHSERLARVKARVGAELDAAHPHGLGAAELHRLVAAHGAGDVLEALRHHGAKLEGGRVRGKAKLDDEAAEKANARSAGGEARPYGTAGTPESPLKLPPGTRRIWRNRIMERGTDEKWHVVGHVAGLEDRRKPPLLGAKVDAERARKLKERLRAAGKPDAARAVARAKKG